MWSRVWNFLRSLPTRIWFTIVFIFLAIVQEAVGRILSHLVPPGTEETVFSRISQWVQVVLTTIPTGWLLAASIGAILPYLWDERKRFISAIKSKFWQLTSQPVEIEPSEPDYESLDKKEKFSVFEAAHYWVEQEPPPRNSHGKLIPTEKAKRIHIFLHDEIDKKTLEAELSISRSRRIISRDELIKAAEWRNEKPKFLYPEMRETNKDSDHTVALREAAIRAYEQSNAADFGPIKMGGEKDRIRFHIESLFNDAREPNFFVLGKRPPSRNLQPVSIDDLDTHRLSDDYSHIKRIKSWGEIMWDDLSVLQTDLDGHIQRLKKRQPKPDYDKWDEKDKFRLFEGACLWVEEEPDSATGNMSLRAHATFKLLAAAIKNKKLGMRAPLDEAVSMAIEEICGGVANPIHVNIEVTREDLREFAQSLSKRPKFLFKSERP